MARNKGSQYRKKPMKGQLHPKSLARNEPSHVFGPVISTNGPKITAVYKDVFTAADYAKRLISVGLCFALPIIVLYIVTGGN